MTSLFMLWCCRPSFRRFGWEAKNEEDYNKAGVLGLAWVAFNQLQNNETLNEKGPKRMSPFFIPSCLINLASGKFQLNMVLKVPTTQLSQLVLQEHMQ